jgi:hypothetical protein
MEIAAPFTGIISAGYAVNKFFYISMKDSKH